MKFAGLELNTPGDIIVGGISFAAGSAADAFFFSGGMTSTAVGGATAIGALGIFQAIKKIWYARKTDPQSDEEEEAHTALGPGEEDKSDSD